MESTVVKDHHIVAVGEGPCKPAQENLKAVAVEAPVLREKPLARFRLNGSVETKVLVAGPRGLNRLYAGKGDPVSCT
jgi:hypothetical protein